MTVAIALAVIIWCIVSVVVALGLGPILRRVSQAQTRPVRRVGTRPARRVRYHPRWPVEDPRRRAKALMMTAAKPGAQEKSS
jgi:hypothetical protein